MPTIMPLLSSELKHSRGLTTTITTIVASATLIVGCDYELPGLNPEKIPGGPIQDASPMEAEAAKLDLTEFDFANPTPIPLSGLQAALNKISFPKTISIGPGSTEAAPTQIAATALTLQATECDTVAPALDQIRANGSTLTFDFGYDYSNCAKKEWEKDGTKVDEMKYQISQSLTLTCPGYNYDAVDGKTLQELASMNLTSLLACNYNGEETIDYTFKLLMTTQATGAEPNGERFSVDQRVSKVLGNDSGPCELTSVDNVLTVANCFQYDRNRTTVSGFGGQEETVDVLGRIDMQGFFAPRSQRYFQSNGPAEIQINDWTGTATFNGSTNASVTLTSGNETFEGTLTP